MKLFIISQVACIGGGGGGGISLESVLGAECWEGHCLASGVFRMGLMGGVVEAEPSKGSPVELFGSPPRNEGDRALLSTLSSAC